MLYKLKLKNADEHVLLDDYVYDHIAADPHYCKIKFLDNLRRHSSGCAVFQKSWRVPDGGYRIETIYLHRLVAELFLKKPADKTVSLVGAINGNKLDCRLENLQWRSRSVASRQRKRDKRRGLYTGVYRENNKFRAIISVNGKTMHLGMYQTPEEAAEAYNEKALELFGEAARLNRIKK